MTTTHIVYCTGMHCASCSIVVQDVVEHHDCVDAARVFIQKGEVHIQTNNDSENIQDIITTLNPLLHAYGYTLYIEKPERKIVWGDYLIALGLTAILLGAFLLLQKVGLINIVHGSQGSYRTSFLLGIVASLSSCLAVVGGLVLALGTWYAEQTKSSRPQILFHIGRLGGFFVLGGLLGLLGSTLVISPVVGSSINIVVGIFIFVLGCTILGLFKGGLTLHKGLFSWLSSASMGIVGPFVLGVITFFVPCGFTQSMQLYALSTGSFLKGALTMVTFAAGTFPVLFLLSITGKTINQKTTFSNIFFKTIGMLLIILGLYNILTSLAVLGIIPPLFTL